MGLILFTLTMPGCGSWNGVDTGAGRFHGIIKSLSNEDSKRVLETKDYRYTWDDGWSANIEVQKITGKDRPKIERRSEGFRGYDWMVDSIIKHGKIITEKELGEKE